MEPGLAATAVYKTPVQNYPNGCHICEVEIDMETGEMEIVRYSVVDDVGTVLNPMLLHGQIHGGVAQGAGQVLMEDIHFDSSGQLVTASFMDYAMPRAHNLSAMQVEANPVPTKTNPLGTKGAGEAGCVGALPGRGQCGGRRAGRIRHQAHRDAGDVRAHLAGDAKFALVDRGAGLNSLGREILGRQEHGNDFLGVSGVARLDGDVELGAFGRHIEEQPAMGRPPGYWRRVRRGVWRMLPEHARAGPLWSGETTRCGSRARAPAP